MWTAACTLSRASACVRWRAAITDTVHPALTHAILRVLQVGRKHVAIVLDSGGRDEPDQAAQQHLVQQRNSVRVGLMARCQTMCVVALQEVCPTRKAEANPPRSSLYKRGEAFRGFETGITTVRSSPDPLGQLAGLSLEP